MHKYLCVMPDLIGHPDQEIDSRWSLPRATTRGGNDKKDGNDTSQRRQRGFTIIESLISIMLILILSSAFVLYFKSASAMHKRSLRFANSINYAQFIMEELRSQPFDSLAGKNITNGKIVIRDISSDLKEIILYIDKPAFEIYTLRAR
ncbi:MAG: hypothetical protein FD145_200 [Candidatus Saganbacteria bacterium]|uniref:Prepilin-type N-terminal cleavage/methylation domain-containing protein n=1 Tax=Candidatus Saganbacteria bacterium TaxID=2575572 RepID=A0A833NZ31_UNCSA|nr:MAG: hypothetical protein FD145_200 [Candidatus Saganbacteria bacterium]